MTTKALYYRKDASWDPHAGGKRKKKKNKGVARVVRGRMHKESHGTLQGKELSNAVHEFLPPG